MKCLRIIQKEHAKWLKHNFPNVLQVEALLGLNEELGELYQAIKLNDTESLYDSIGDIGIYLVSFCTTNNIFIDDDVITNYNATIDINTYDALRQLSIEIGLLNHYFLKNIQGIRHTKDSIHAKFVHQVAAILFCLQIFCTQNSDDFLTIINVTWENVRKRDWIKYPEKGLPS